MSNVRNADRVVRNIDWLVAADASRRVARDAAIAVVAGRFAAVSKAMDIERGWRAEAAVDGRNAVVTPGLLDDHLHPRP